jgi:uncharacterized glyoxalase superfamily protein PhnB
MSKQDLFDQLDDALNAVLTSRDAQSLPLHRSLRPLVSLGDNLRLLPRPEFKAALRAKLTAEYRKNQLKNEASPGSSPETTLIPAHTNPIREGFHTITPYLHPRSADRLIAFLTEAFGAELIVRVPRSDGSVMHAQLRIGDSMIEMGEPQGPYEVLPSAIHLYVPNADAVYESALRAGAVSLQPMTEQAYGDREGCVRDPENNNWYIATHRLTGSAPRGLRTITPYIHAQGADKVVEFLIRGFGAQELERAQSADGIIHHAKLRLGDSVLEIGEAHGQWQAMPAALHLYVPDTDALYDRVIAAGGISMSPPADAPYGDRAAVVSDQFGNFWYLATQLRVEPT